jgi:hypothetical protein
MDAISICAMEKITDPYRFRQAVMKRRFVVTSSTFKDQFSLTTLEHIKLKSISKKALKVFQIGGYAATPGVGDMEDISWWNFSH